MGGFGFRLSRVPQVVAFCLCSCWGHSMKSMSRKQGTLTVKGLPGYLSGFLMLDSQA